MKARAISADPGESRSSYPWGAPADVHTKRRQRDGWTNTVDASPSANGITWKVRTRLRTMMPRLTGGATVAALPAAGSIAFGTTGSPVLAAVFAAISVTVLVLAVANHLPLLHLLPVVGAAKLGATIKADGRHDLTVGISPTPPDPQFGGSGGYAPRSIEIQVGIHNPGRSDLDRATVTLLHPEGLPHRETDERGVLGTKGKWMPATGESLKQTAEGEPLWSDYWVRTTTLYGRRHHLLFFVLTVPGPGEYPIRLKVVSAALYEPFVQDVTVRVCEVGADDQSATDLMARAISAGEQLISDLVHPGKGLGSVDAQFTPVVAMAHSALARGDRVDLKPILAAASKREAGPGEPTYYFVDQVKEYVAALYDVRRRLGAS